MAPNKTILARAKVDQEFPLDFAIYDLARFLNVVSLFDKPELTFEEHFVRISSDKHNINYTYCQPDSIVSVPMNKNPKMPPTYVRCTITNDILSACLKAASVLKVPEIAIVGDGSNLFLKAINNKNPTMDTYSIEIGETDKTCSFNFNTSKLGVIAATYNVTIGVGDRVFCHFDGGDQEYFISVDESSKYE